MKMMAFQEWLVIREGLCLNDDKSVEDLSKLPHSKSKKPSSGKPLLQAGKSDVERCPHPQRHRSRSVDGLMAWILIA